MHDFNFWGGGWMMIFWILLFIALVVLFLIAFRNTGSKEESAMEILKKRYARGEIDKEEFEERKNEILK